MIHITYITYKNNIFFGTVAQSRMPETCATAIKVHACHIQACQSAAWMTLLT